LPDRWNSSTAENHSRSIVIMRGWMLTLCVLLVTACEGSPAGPTSSLNSEFTLALSVRFDRVVSDSRCPADAVCIQAGTAEVQITAKSGSSTGEYVLQTDKSKSAQHENLIIELVQLMPHPLASRPTQSSDYRATLRVSRQP
jgi:hypothetical protein